MKTKAMMRLLLVMVCFAAFMLLACDNDSSLNIDLRERKGIACNEQWYGEDCQFFEPGPRRMR